MVGAKGKARTSVLMTGPCSILEIRMKSETWFYLKVKRLTLGFLVLQMSHKKRVSFISISFAVDFFFKIGFPPDPSNF